MPDKSNRRAIYPGTFDPVTNGHLDLLERALRIFDEVIVAVGSSGSKKPLFTLEERVDLLKRVSHECRGVRVEPFDSLLVDYARERGALVIVRGLRAISDFEYELQMALMNRRLEVSVETVFLMPSEEYSFITSSIVREVASFGGDVTSLVPPVVGEALGKKFPGRRGPAA